jgi:hypothetical protein
MSRITLLHTDGREKPFSLLREVRMDKAKFVPSILSEVNCSCGNDFIDP